MNILVTGGTGFIGRTLVPLLMERGHKVRVVTRREERSEPGCDFRTVDLVQCDQQGMAELLEGVDVVVNLAASISDESAMRGLHVDFVRRLMGGAARTGAKVVHLSSVGVYGASGAGVVTEGSAKNPVGFYEETKLESEAIVRQCAEKWGTDFVIFQPSNVYGADMGNRSLVALISMIKRGLYIPICGSRFALANYVHVDDVCRAIALWIGREKYGCETYILNCSDTMESFVASIYGSLNLPVPKYCVPTWALHVLALPGLVFSRAPLKPSRVRALTSRVEYDGSKITRDSSFRYEFRPIDVAGTLLSA